jgi:hypothetical protein
VLEDRIFTVRHVDSMNKITMILKSLKKLNYNPEPKFYTAALVSLSLKFSKETKAVHRLQHVLILEESANKIMVKWYPCFNSISFNP